ncbi:MAG: hypothetical protein ACNA8R_12530 [Nitriliruptoraceae bacterium]
MDALNTLRAVLVAFSAVAAIMLAFQGQFFPAGILFFGILAHLALFAYLRIDRRRTAADDPFERLLQGS